MKFGRTKSERAADLNLEARQAEFGDFRAAPGCEFAESCFIDCNPNQAVATAARLVLAECSDESPSNGYILEVNAHCKGSSKSFWMGRGCEIVCSTSVISVTTHEGQSQTPQDIDWSTPPQ